MDFTGTISRRISAFAFILASALVLAGTAFPPAAAAGTAEAKGTKELIARIVKAYGGRAAVDGLRTLSAEGEITAPMLFEGRASYRRFLERGGRLRVEIERPGYREIRILNGRRGYYGATGSPVAPVAGPRYEAMRYQYAELTMPQRLLAGDFEVRREGTSSVNGRPVIVLGLRGRGGLRMKLYVDAERFLILKNSSLFSMGGAETELASEFGDFRPVGGTVLPYHIANFAGGQAIGETVIGKYRMNTRLDPSLFLP